MSKKKIQALEAQLAVHEMLGQFRYIVINGEIWFACVDVAKILEIEKVRNTIANFPEKEKVTAPIMGGHSGKRGGARFLVFINEPGLYRLIFRSRKPEAGKFKRWVFHDVLPSIRKYGYYSFIKSEDVKSDYEKALEILRDLEAKGIEWDCIFEGVTLKYNEKAKEFRPCYKLKITA